MCRVSLEKPYPRVKSVAVYRASRHLVLAYLRMAPGSSSRMSSMFYNRHICTNVTIAMSRPTC